MEVLLSHTHSIVCASAYFEPKKSKNIKKFYKRDIMELFITVDTTILKKNIFFSTAKNSLVCPDS